MRYAVIDQVVGEDLELAQQVMSKVVAFLVANSFKLIGALIILALGWWLANAVSRWVERFCTVKGLDITLSRFLAGALRLVLLLLAVIMALNKFDIEVTPFVAMIGAGTLGISLALQGPISNYGAGFIIVVARPFVVGDTITINGYSGVVEEVKLGFTRLLTEDGEIVTIPNKHIVGEIQTNSKGNRIVESIVGVDYATDPAHVINTVQRALLGVPGIVSDPEPQVGIDSFADSSIAIGYRYWVPSRNYHALRFAANRAVLEALRNQNIQIPFPQRVVTIQPNGSSVLS